MRILVLTDRLSLRGGADLHLRQVVTAAAAAGARVTWAFGRADGTCVPPAGVAARTLRGLAAALPSTSRLAGLGALLADADVVHVQNVMNPTAISAAVATGRAVVTVQDHRVFCPASGKTLPDGAPCREPMHDAVCRGCLQERAYRERTLAVTAARRSALRGARLLVLSGYMRDELAAVGLGGAEVLPPWVELARPRGGSGEVLLLAGRMVAHKAPLDAWQAWRAAGAPLPLEVAGEGPLTVRLDGARRLGWLGSDALREVFGRARAVLMPARWQEPFGMVGLEALAAGVPVIAADVGGTREWSDVGCLRVPAGDIAAMAEAVARLAREPETARRMGREGREAVARRFARETLERRQLGVYEEIAGAASKGRVGPVIMGGP